MAELNARIIAKASATTGEEPVASDLEVAELAVNTADGKIFTKHTDNSIVVISGGTGGGGATSLDDLSDVDTTTTLPTDGQALTWVAANNQWEPADASGGGGAVNSVAGKTGAVTLEISDNTDVSTKTTYSQSGGAAAYSVSGNATGYVQRILLNSDRLVFANGDVTPGSTLEYLRDTAVLPFTIQTYVDGVLSTDATVTVVDTTSDPSALWITADWTDAEVNAASTFFIEATADPTDGQVLTWVDLDARWKPAQLPDTTTTWQLTANGSTDYIFTGPGLDGVNDPTIYLMRGQTYKFVNEMGAHPFKIQQVGGAAYSSGITNNEVSNGTLTFEVPMEAPSILEYVCTSHAAMTGTIHILAEDSISLATLKTEVAASTDFTDFQSRIAAL